MLMSIYLHKYVNTNKKSDNFNPNEKLGMISLYVIENFDLDIRCVILSKGEKFNAEKGEEEKQKQKLKKHETSVTLLVNSLILL